MVVVDPSIDTESEKRFEKKSRLHKGVLHESMGWADGCVLLLTSERSNANVLRGVKLSTKTVSFWRQASSFKLQERSSRMAGRQASTHVVTGRVIFVPPPFELDLVQEEGS